MLRRTLLFAVLLAAAPLAAQSVDTSGSGALVRDAMDHSEVMRNLEYLSDVIGPRLSGSAAMKRANEWTAQRFRDYGLAAHLESYPFGPTWERGEASLRLLAPFTRAMTAYSWAWTEGTPKGAEVSGPVVRINGSADSLEAWLPRVKGAWVMLAEPAFVWNPDGPPMTADDSAGLKAAQERRAEMFRKMAADTTGRLMKEMQQANYDRAFRLRKAGALGEIYDGAKEFGLVTMSGSPNAVSPFPRLVVSHEDYLLLHRLLARGETPRLAGRVRNVMGTTPVEQFNTVAELRGTERPEEVVILGAHLDSWDLGTGVSDNGTGSMVVLEAARVLARSSVRPRRTIRFVLFSGEEQGLLGSRAYAAAHAADMDRVQAVLVLDNGTGRITGQALQGRDELEQMWQDLLAPVASLGADRVRKGNKSGTDHLAFIPYGVPGFNFDQETRGYNHTHHSQVDTYDHAVPGDLAQASAVLAVAALGLANLDQLLPRGPRRAVDPDRPMRPSPGLAAR
jgi:hypothetical protein